MCAKEMHWVIKFTPEGVTVDVSSPKITPSVENLPEEETGIRLSKERGVRINFIRVVYTLCKLGYFTKDNGSKISDIQVFRLFGNFLNTNLSNYYNDLNHSMQVGFTPEKHTRIFEEMERILNDKFNRM